ncbi:MAG: SdpI family protein [Bifidobacteriaceae bacterium]|jgi:hypothetical protein|nr:SdpI family protein [Bifidobacteriaceae bacterium]
METVNCAVLVVVGGFLAVLGGFIRAQRLPRNHLVGIRTLATWRSESAWRAGNRAGGSYVVAGGLALASGGLGAVAVVLTGGSRQVENALLGAGVILALAAVLGSGVVATMAAKRATVVDN